MTILGKALKQLLNTAEVKQVQLAESLGYDVSYINLWINNAKVPSLKNNSNILREIAGQIYCLATENEDTIRNIIIHKGTILDYIFKGNINIFGKAINLTIQERTEHLQYILQHFSHTHIQIFVIEDSNPVLPKTNSLLDLFLSKNSLFLHDASNHLLSTYHSDNMKFIENFNLFWKIFEENYSLQHSSNHDIFQIIETGIKLLNSL